MNSQADTSVYDVTLWLILTWYTWSVVLFFRTLTEMVVLSGSAIRSSTSVTPL